MADSNRKTITFDIKQDRENEIREIIGSVYNSLMEKGYNPINQLVGYIMSEDPTYITNYNNARGLIRKFEREELMKVLLKNYLNNIK
ncbi:MAG: IreB family regulatory phosphoprotein [Ruminococcaceae bacterium]|nr:IreB family regulatory phosphoprotein [Oscillospiraceae bacterium]